MRPPAHRPPVATAILLAALTACADPADEGAGSASAGTDTDLLLTGGRVYTLAWSPPAGDGTPATDAPRSAGGWRPDAEAILVRDGRVAWVGADAEASERFAGARRIELDGATVLPGLVDSHTHVRELGANLRRVDLLGVDTEDEVIARLRAAATERDDDGWLVGWGWDEGAWASPYPTWDRLSAAFPERPVVLRSLHGFAVWANRAAFAAAGIDDATEAPTGGELLREPDGGLTGVLLNRASTLLTEAVPEPTPEELEREILAGLEEMVRSGYVAVHEAGLDGPTLEAYRRLERRGDLPLRVYAMVSARDRVLMESVIAAGPACAVDRMLRVCSVKAFWDGALGSRGARLLEDYSDRPGHRGVSGDGYGFDQELVTRAVAAGFQAAVHAIGDAGNRETLDFLSRVLAAHPEARSLRHRVEHAQVVHPDDFARFADLGLTASMQPPHMAEDRSWAEERLGPERIAGAYAWRTFRRLGVPLVFSSDLAGSDHDIFYGLHSAVWRRSRDGTPTAGWYPEQGVTMEEALRAYTLAGAHASFLDGVSGHLAVGRFADLTVIDVDPFTTTDAASLLGGKVLLTMVGGAVLHRSGPLAAQAAAVGGGAGETGAPGSGAP